MKIGSKVKLKQDHIWLFNLQKRGNKIPEMNVMYTVNYIEIDYNGEECIRFEEIKNKLMEYGDSGGEFEIDECVFQSSLFEEII